MNFKEGIKLNVSQFLQSIDGADYLSWATAVALAGRPLLEVRTFGGKPYLDMFGGALVATDQGLDQVEQTQETWMPIIDERWRPMGLEEIDAMIIHQQLMRAKAKSVAMVSGIGLSVYNGSGGNGLVFVKALGLTPDSDLATAQPLETNKGGVSYIAWPAALAAARLTDPLFSWKVNFSEALDWHSGEIRQLPVISLHRGYMVSVSVRYKEAEHTEYLPIMGDGAGGTGLGGLHQTLETPSVFDWNTAVMRALTKAIAVISGYGLGTYAKEDIEKIALSVKTIPQAKAKEEKSQPKAETTVQPVAEKSHMAESEKRLTQLEQSQQDALIQELEELLPKDAPRRERIFKACLTRGLVKEVPKTSADLVKMSREAAKQVITGLKAQSATVKAN